jgi:nucleoside-diphosphate-sugar epimerase
MTHIDNAAQAHELALLALLRGHMGGKAYFIGQERPLPLWKTVNEILRRLGHPPVTRRIPYFLAYMSGYILEKLSRSQQNHPEPAMTRFLALALGKDHYFSHRAAREELGYIPKISIEEAMKDYDSLTLIP